MKVDTSLKPGDYTGHVLYTATANSSPAPTITSISPDAGMPGTGTLVTITGSNFDSAYAVKVGTIGSNPADCTSATIVSSTSITCTVSGQLSAGKHNVAVSTWGGTATLPNSFTVAPEEVFKFTIDTRMTDTLDTSPSHYSGVGTTFYIPVSGYVNGSYSNHSLNWRIDWGDGSGISTASGTSSLNSGIPHTYPSPGAYQISIRPNGVVADGWMNAFGFYPGTAETAVYTSKIMFKSIDSPFTNSMRTPGSTHRFAYMFYGLKNAAGIPANLFSNIDISSDTNLYCMFQNTFFTYASNSTSAIIPAGLFNFIDMSSATYFLSMFDHTFAYYASANTSNGTPGTDINIIWGNANFAGKITAGNVGSTIGVFFNTFLVMPSLLGSAQTFIDTKLDGITPSDWAGTFRSTGVSDLGSLHTNWK